MYSCFLLWHAFRLSFTFNGAFVFFFFFVLRECCQAWCLLLSFPSFLLLKLVCVSSSAYVASPDGAAVLAQVWSSKATEIGNERWCCLGHLSRSVTTLYLSAQHNVFANVTRMCYKTLDGVMPLNLLGRRRKRNGRFVPRQHLLILCCRLLASYY